MSTVRVKDICPVSGWLISVQRQRYAHCLGGRIPSCVKGMSSVRVEELILVLGLINCPRGRTLSSVRCMSSDPGSQNSVLHQGYVQWLGGRTLSSARGVFNVRVAQLCSVSGVYSMS
ncbi:hypothetical protein TNCV_3540851 [Trichonephila clavipes]|nr:hypothetical protein TNCV_3540851 [Trichonephila clavipes]